jgi:uncharacterized protein YndB with AHSA1/START domain
MYILIALIAVLIISALIGYFMPQEVKIEKSIIIHAPKEVVFAEIASLPNFVTWSPWSDKDPTMSQSFQGHPGTVGSRYTWKGNKKVGEGSMETTAIQLNEFVAYTMNFGNRGTAQAIMRVEENKGVTRMTWAFTSNVGKNPLMHLMGPVMASMVGKDYNSGLQNLKQKLEKNL